jgi:hypothetical protein
MKHFKVILIFAALLIVFFNSCKKLDDLPLLEKVSFNLYTDSILCKSSVFASIDDIKEKGICWSLQDNPSINDNKIANNNISNIGYFFCAIKGTKPDVRYYVRSYATNKNGTSYGPTSEIEYGLILTKDVSQITLNSAKCGGVILSDGGSAITKRGVCFNLTGNPTIEDNVTINGLGVGEFESELNNLVENTQYYVRSYATNMYGTFYGITKQFKTFDIKPTISTIAASNVKFNNLTCGGIIISTGASAIIKKGLCYGTSPNPNISDNIVVNSSNLSNFTEILNNLNPETTYYIRAYATNNQGTGYGEQIIVKTTKVIGSFYQGGVIGYVFKLGDLGYVSGEIHGIIVAPKDQNPSLGTPWGCLSYDLRNLNLSPNIGFGKSNTELIVSSYCKEQNIAARLCDNLNLNGYSDWYLPSMNELNKIYLNKSEINTTALANGGVIFNETMKLYWSSTDVTTTEAYTVSFLTGIQNITWRTYNCGVRAVRSF